MSKKIQTLLIMVKLRILDYSVDYMKPHGRYDYIEPRMGTCPCAHTCTHTTLTKDCIYKRQNLGEPG